MAEFSKDNISNALNILGIKNKNQGTSTGQENFGEGDLVNSYSPVDGSLIGSVSSSSKKDYEKAMHSAVKAFGKAYLPHKEVK
jgi:aldehyde dehydrogenase (NAD+)